MRVKNVDRFEIETLGEILVGYDYDADDPSDFNINSVEVVFGGQGYDIKGLLAPRVIDFIEENLSFNVFNS